MHLHLIPVESFLNHITFFICSS
uniref:Uncharacterized protein n=1 Tax=Anguilla anguilla TaxID=7936 RepID=A0A0E9RBP4_ANGAN